MTCLAILALGLLFVGGLVLTFISSTAYYSADRCSCGYDLTHLDERSKACPECGLARRNMIAIRHPILLNIGLAMLLAPFAFAALVALAAFALALR